MAKLLSDFVSIMMVGFSVGSLFGLIGLAYTVVINSCQLVNFGQGDFAIFGVAVCWFVITVLGWPLWAAFIIAVIMGGLLGVVTERVMITPLLKKQVHDFYPILGTMAVGMILAGAEGVYTGFYWMPVPAFLGTKPWRPWGVPIDRQNALVILATILLVIAYWFFLNRTLLGTALRATGYNRDVSLLLGIETSKMVGLSFLINGVIAGVAGVLSAPISPYTALDGLPLAVDGFIALIVGGWGNPYAAVLGGLTLGVMRALLIGYFSSAYAELATFGLLIVVLTLKPSGLYAGFKIARPRLRTRRKEFSMGAANVD